MPLAVLGKTLTSLDNAAGSFRVFLTQGQQVDRLSRSEVFLSLCSTMRAYVEHA